MSRGGRMVTRSWPDDPTTARALDRPRDDLVLERRDGDGAFAQAAGPFLAYRRTVEREDDRLVERTSFHLAVPWFGWVFAIPVRLLLGRRWHPPDGSVPDGYRPWWAPPDRLNVRQVRVLGLLAAGSMAAAFINTVFTQTVEFAADEFGIDNTGIGDAGSIVRAGIVIAMPAAFVADRIGRRRVVVAMAWAAPLLTALGALAPSFSLLVVSQTLGRPLGLALAFLIGVVAAEEMPRNSRAYALSVLAMASGLGAGLAVMALPLADLGDRAWRLVYVVGVVWVAVAIDLTRRLPETRRFEAAHPVAPPFDRRRFAALVTVAVASNLFVSPASFFQNSYLSDERGYSATGIAILTLATATPAGIGLVLGGRLADVHGRKRVVAVALPLSTAFLVMSYSTAGATLIMGVFLGGLLGSIVFPALSVYRTELFPTGNRSKVAGLVTAAALLGGIIGLRSTGVLLDRGWSHGVVMGLFALGQVVVVIVVLTSYPETAHRELEDLNPEDAVEPATPR